MTFWLDASVLVALITREPTSHQIDTLLDQSEPPMVSDFCIAECSSAIARLVRIGTRTADEADELFRNLDDWVATASNLVAVDQGDFSTATDFVRLPGVALRAPDAIHIAAAQRIGATLLTLDRGMARAADLLGVPCINPAAADAPGDLKD
ncbi:type II toxin-antitoxin system VapC family toxin [Brevundimonas sp.]|uniref:type II toxin-antitoxin system VapC family toxin n=1 Tax=Brevundimonas sp. TaxID=1871086 RepID=UPI003F71BD65